MPLGTWRKAFNNDMTSFMDHVTCNVKAVHALFNHVLAQVKARTGTAGNFARYSSAQAGTHTARGQLHGEICTSNLYLSYHSIELLTKLNFSQCWPDVSKLLPQVPHRRLSLAGVLLHLPGRLTCRSLQPSDQKALLMVFSREDTHTHTHTLHSMGYGAAEKVGHSQLATAITIT